jgi:hypothetical protein
MNAFAATRASKDTTPTSLLDALLGAGPSSPIEKYNGFLRNSAVSRSAGAEGRNSNDYGIRLNMGRLDPRKAGPKPPL